MKVLEKLRQLTTELPAPQMLEVLIKQKFVGETVVTASLKSPSVVVLKMISDIDPSTPVIFCHPQNVFPESEEYRSALIDLLGLRNVKVVTRSDTLTDKREFERVERLRSDAPDGVGKIQESIHLHDTLSPYKCWIKAAYHEKPDTVNTQRVNLHGGMFIVDALRRRTIEMVDRLMQEYDLPYHPKIRKRKQRPQVDYSNSPEIGSHY
ncbi:MAG: phosphoadenosine phosphosulfate reductase family protein [Hyphomicrobiales bacterium]